MDGLIHAQCKSFLSDRCLLDAERALPHDLKDECEKLEVWLRVKNLQHLSITLFQTNAYHRYWRFQDCCYLVCLHFFRQWITSTASSTTRQH